MSAHHGRLLLSQAVSAAGGLPTILLDYGFFETSERFLRWGRVLFFAAINLRAMTRKRGEN
jgi:hypothetical protein